MRRRAPFMALLILAALQTLPKDIYEAARVDGVRPWRVFLRITLPLIRTPLMVAAGVGIQRERPVFVLDEN